jgi:hypothetical protein
VNEGRQIKITTLIDALAAFPYQHESLDFDLKERRWRLMREIKRDFPDLGQSVKNIMGAFSFGKKTSTLHQIFFTDSCDASCATL